MGLPGLRTDNYDLQDKIIDFLNKLIDCGADGFRFDAAKNIALPSENNCNFWIRVLGELKKKDLFNYAEVIFTPKNLIDEYCKYINVLTDSIGSDKSKLVTFVESHDSYLDDKIKKQDGNMQISLKRTQDILGYLGEHRTDDQIICGFSMETRDMLENSWAKLQKKHVDMICANNLKVPGAGFGVDTNVITIITQADTTELPLLSKEEVSNTILDKAIALSKQ